MEGEEKRDEIREETKKIEEEITEEKTVETETEKNEENTEEKAKPEEEKPKEKKKEKYIEIKKSKFDGSAWYDRNYKKLLLISIIVLIACFAYITVFYVQTGDIMYKDVTLTGGTIVTVFTEQEINIQEIENFLSGELDDVSVRKLEDITTRRQIAVIVETKSDPNTAINALEDFFGYTLDETNSSVEMSGASLSESFYNQMLIALIIAFLIMAVIIFIIFRKIVPSLAVVLAAVTDIVGALVIANIFGFHISTAGIAAFLMLVGYSVDTDVMLTTKVIKRRGEGPLNKRIHSAARTGLTMTITSLIAVLIGFFVAQSSILKQIFFILSAGLFIDLISTWFGNASILKWWSVKRNIS